MDKIQSIYNWLSQRNYVHYLILALLVKGLISDVGYATFLLTIPVLAFEGFKLYIKSKTPDKIQLDQELKRELDNIKAKVHAGSLEKSVKPAQRYF